MAVKRRRRIDMSVAVASIREQVRELTHNLGGLNDSLEGLAQQIGRFGSLTREVTAPSPYAPGQPAQDMRTYRAVEASRTSPTGLVFSAEELAKKAALLGQFDDKARMREEIEADMENGA